MGWLNDEIHATHSCYVCSHAMAWVGHVFGGLTLSHGNEVDATLSVSRERNERGQVELAVQLQCPECGAVNQFHVLHDMDL